MNTPGPGAASTMSVIRPNSVSRCRKASEGPRERQSAAWRHRSTFGRHIPLPHRGETTEKRVVARVALPLAGRSAAGGVIWDRLLLCSLGPQGGSDWVEVDEDGGPNGLEPRFSGPEVAALAPSVAVDDESEQPLDSRPGALEMVALGGIG
jgi:hypothetical protein